MLAAALSVGEVETDQVISESHERGRAISRSERPSRPYTQSLLIPVYRDRGSFHKKPAAICVELPLPSCRHGSGHGRWSVSRQRQTSMRSFCPTFNETV